MPRPQRIDLANLDQCARWEKMLNRASELYAQNFFRADPYKGDFVKDMVNRTANERPMWNPTLKQWNFLHTIIGESNG